MILPRKRKFLIFFLLLLAVIIVSWGFSTKYYRSDNEQVDQSNPNEIEAVIDWTFHNDEWTAVDSVPDCDELIFEIPVDIEQVTSVLYPGQYRGDDYKAHGGFRFDESGSAEIIVKAPFDAYAFRGSRYIESGELQYWIDFIDPCGRIFRFDHLKKLSTDLFTLVSELPEPKENDSRSKNFNAPMLIMRDTIIATSVGIKDNVFVDFGMYDLRQKNEISQSAEWLSKKNTDLETDPYGICWLEYLPADQQMYLFGLPAGKEGKVSDYCD